MLGENVGCCSYNSATLPCETMIAVAVAFLIYCCVCTHVLARTESGATSSTVMMRSLRSHLLTARRFENLRSRTKSLYVPAGPALQSGSEQPVRFLHRTAVARSHRVVQFLQFSCALSWFLLLREYRYTPDLFHSAFLIFA